MKSEDFISVAELLGHFRGQPMSTIFQSSAAYPENCWRVRNSGVWGQPTLSAETLAVETACDNLGVETERYWSATPLNPDSFRIEAPFLDGGFFCMTGNYFYGNKGGWVSGARTACAIALELGLRIRPSWLRNYDLEFVSLEETRNEILKDQDVRKVEKERREKEEAQRRAEEEAEREERARIVTADKQAALRSEIATALEKGEISDEQSFRIWHYSCGRVSDEIYVYSDKVCPRCGDKHSPTEDVTDLVREITKAHIPKLQSG